MITRSRFTVWLATLAALALVAAPATGQTADPSDISVDSSSNVCTGGSEDFPVSLTLPDASIVDNVDVFFLFDDTGSFASFVPTVTGIFSGLVTDLETELPGVEFGFGVGRFEDYGGPGTGFSGEVANGRPFTLNQPIVTAATAGGDSARDTLINDALDRTAPGFGGDGPETALEALWQAATGNGFDGDGNGSTLDSGSAGDPTTQTSPGTSGDVPAFSSNVAPTSGTLGGAGWRSGSLRLVILATDIGTVAAYPAGETIPATITGAGGSEPSSAFHMSSTVGASRFGFVSDAKTTAANTVSGAVAPSGSATVQDTVDALNSLGVRVIGMGPGASPTTSTGPSSDESVLLSALARLTGAVDDTDTALVFSTSVSSSDLSEAISDAVSASATGSVDIGLTTTALPAGLSFASAPTVVSDVGPGGTASFTVTLTGDGSAISGSFDINFIDVASGAVLGSVPVSIDCASASDTTAPSCELTDMGQTADGRTFIEVTTQDSESGLEEIVVTKATNVDVTFDPDPFTVGTNDPVVVTATKVDESKRAQLALDVFDQAGNKTSCDPVLVTVTRGTGQPVTEVVDEIPEAEGTITVTNGDPGIRNLEIVVNGDPYRVAGLADGSETSIDVSASMHPGDDNVVELTARGRPGASAVIMIWEGE